MAGARRAGFLEDLAELGFAFAIELPHDLGAVEVNEVHAALGGDRAGEQRLARAGRAVQQHALRREDAQPLEDARVLQRQLDDLAHPRDLALQPADVLVGHCGRAGGGLLAVHEPDVGALPDHDGSGGNRAHDLKIHRFGEGRHAHNATRDNRHALQILEHALGRDDRPRHRPQR